MGGLSGGGLQGLPVLMGKLVGQATQGRRAAHRRHLGAVLAHLLVAKQQRHGPGSQPALGHPFIWALRVSPPSSSQPFAAAPAVDRVFVS